MTPAEAKVKFEDVLRLSPREYETLLLLGKGLSSWEMAERMHCAEKTVWTYVTRLRWKFRLVTYRQVAVFGAEYLATGLSREPVMPTDVLYKFVDPKPNVVSLKVA